MNVVLLVADTVRQDYCGCYGNRWVRTPHIDALAAQSAVMESFFCASFPTGPMRKDLHTGRFTFAYTNWGAPRPEGESVLAELLSDAGILTAWIGDTNNSLQYADGFQHREVVSSRPANLDQTPEDVPLPAAPHKLRFPLDYAQRIARQAAAWDCEADRRVARTMQAAHRWLEDRCRKNEPFFLWVDTFDPHEPWDPPRYYIDAYDPDYAGDELMEPAYQPADYASRREIEHMRCMYAGKLTMVDRWIGCLLEGLEVMGLADDTAVLFCSDHGFYHGEHGFIGKVQLDRENRIVRRWPLYATIARAPLLVRLPGLTGGRRFRTFCQPPDVMATVLDLFGLAPPEAVQGASLLPVVRRQRESIREFAVTALTHITDDEVRSPCSFRTADHLYIYGGDEWESELYDVAADPREECNLIASHTDAARELHGRYLRFLGAIGCPRLSLDARREFRPTARAELPYRRLI